MDNATGYELVRLANGVHSVHALAEGETFHPVIGPVAEAEALYVQQLHLRERFAATAGEFVIWDIGLGAAANVLTVLRALRGQPGQLRLESFDHTLAPLEFALQQAALLGYLEGFEVVLGELIQNHHATITAGAFSSEWTVHHGDFPTLLATEVVAATRRPAPDAILFDAFSPARNPAMWTLPLFTNLFRCLNPERPCALPTYSRSTLLRVTLLLAGFFVGAGHATGEKEETTIAANSMTLIDEPLDRKWLERVRRSTSAEPLHTPVYRQAPLSGESWERLRTHPQFR